MLSQLSIADMSGQGFAHGVFALINPKIDINKKGDNYLRCLLRDSTGEVTGLMWHFDNWNRSLSEISATGFVKIEASQKIYEGELQIEIKEIYPSEPTPDEMTGLLPSSHKDIEGMFTDVQSLIRGLEHPAVKALGEAYLDDAILMQKFKVAPAAMQIHHAWIGGLLEHTLQLMELADSMLSKYSRLNRDIVLLGLFIHDLGKTEELRWDGRFEYTREGNLIGHIARGAMWLEDKAKVAETQLGEPLPDGLLTVMQHIVLSHHGQLEYGAAKLPSTPEAIFVSQLDTLDAHTQTALDAARPRKTGVPSGDAFTERLFALNNTKLYKKDPLKG